MIAAVTITLLGRLWLRTYWRFASWPNALWVSVVDVAEWIIVMACVVVVIMRQWRVNAVLNLYFLLRLISATGEGSHKLVGLYASRRRCPGWGLGGNLACGSFSIY